MGVREMWCGICIFIELVEYILQCFAFVNAVMNRYFP
jgi:hypothetical protein